MGTNTTPRNGNRISLLDRSDTIAKTSLFPPAKVVCYMFNNATLNYTYDLERDAPLAGARNITRSSNFLPEKSGCLKKITVRRSDLQFVDVLDIFNTRTKIRAIYLSKRKNSLQKLKIKNKKDRK
ncbi:MAG: hypothetical protein LBL62_05475 [Planctomycetaceae bacterium]|nr:hypothetical protein [Planctomycetaceae bacterium]